MREHEKSFGRVGETRSVFRSLHGNDLNSARSREIVGGRGREWVTPSPRLDL